MIRQTTLVAGALLAGGCGTAAPVGSVDRLADHGDRVVNDGGGVSDPQPAPSAAVSQLERAEAGTQPAPVGTVVTTMGGSSVREVEGGDLEGNGTPGGPDQQAAADRPLSGIAVSTSTDGLSPAREEFRSEQTLCVLPSTSEFAEAYFQELTALGAALGWDRSSGACGLEPGGPVDGPNLQVLLTFVREGERYRISTRAPLRLTLTPDPLEVTDHEGAEYLAELRVQNTEDGFDVYFEFGTNRVTVTEILARSAAEEG